MNPIACSSFQTADKSREKVAKQPSPLPSSSLTDTISSSLISTPAHQPLIVPPISTISGRVQRPSASFSLKNSYRYAFQMLVFLSTVQLGAARAQKPMDLEPLIEGGTCSMYCPPHSTESALYPPIPLTEIPLQAPSLGEKIWKTLQNFFPAAEELNLKPFEGTQFNRFIVHAASYRQGKDFPGFGDLVFGFKMKKLIESVRSENQQIKFWVEDAEDRLFLKNIFRIDSSAFSSEKELSDFVKEEPQNSILIGGPATTSFAAFKEFQKKHSNLKSLFIGEYGHGSAEDGHRVSDSEPKTVSYSTGFYDQKSLGIFLDPHINERHQGTKYENQWLQGHLNKKSFYFAYLSKPESIEHFTEVFSSLHADLNSSKPVRICFPSKMFLADIDSISSQLSELAKKLKKCLTIYTPEKTISFGDIKAPMIHLLFPGSVSIADMEKLMVSSEPFKACTGDQSIGQILSIPSAIPFYENLTHKNRFYDRISNLLGKDNLLQAKSAFDYGEHHPGGYISEDRETYRDPKTKVNPISIKLNWEEARCQFERFRKTLLDKHDLEKQLMSVLNFDV